MESGDLQSPALRIRLDDLRGPEVAALLREHLEDVQQWSPPCSIHALNLQALRGPTISFWTAWEGDALLGCGALRELDARHGEIKSMRTARTHLRRGVAARLLSHMIGEARRRRYSRLSLETGAQQQFLPARALYARFGFAVCAPFGDYSEDPNSVFMTRLL